ncbi:hypothetical protein ASPWEDRAFT_182875 [Aspergillus wentii DTO 134E9]|uniref:UDP-glucose 6-dehydrogenase n=1 Tax=Aspergillus wentii DTO 134E9 TaxID=1073089 RepID=A0A1L9RIH5_ASPWE|nr:uncharacterized protein ASPWEDRAFT_182875 [Aspergillus wentii DTO 134E9]KAI9932305.1 hypothetical protein MW887_009817 [Aspergillus wentii]OJJ34732.1 hypothetical protein ASPWEDRAFT_182875 [Aspergillus wentii DTO 134E9]
MAKDSEDIPMDLLSSPLGTSDESSYDASTGPTTPASSPLFCSSKVDDLTLSHFLHSPASYRLDADASPCDTLGSASSSFQSFPAWGPVKNVCVVGAGYVGGPTAAILALHNPSIKIEVVDRDPRRIQRWTSPHLPVHEPGLENVVRVARDGADITNHDARTDVHVARLKRRPNLFFTCDSAASISQADIIFLAVNTPTKTFGLGAGRATNMTALDEAVRGIARHARPGAIIVEKSTVPCGTAHRVQEILASTKPGVPFEVLSNPEFLAEGSAIDNLTTPDRVLIGSSGTESGRQAARVLASVYASWVPSSRILEINAWSSELAKLVANAMLAQRISSINSISAICERTGAEVDQVAKAIGLDSRIGSQFLKAGLGFGGSCFRKDIASLTYLAESLGLDDVAFYWRQVNVMNEMQRNRFARKVIDRFEGNLVGRKLAMLGFAFKKNTGDTRESLAIDVIRLLLEERPKEIAIFDPYCREEDILRELESLDIHESSSVKVYADAYLACSQANAVLVVTDCDQFRNATVQRHGDSPTLGQQTPCKIRHIPTISNKDLVCHEPGNQDETWVSSGVSYRLTPQDMCATDCTDCHSQSSRPIATDPVEWARVAYSMKDPKWVFDGRGMLDVVEMERLGFRVNAVGRRSAEGLCGISA